jgi:hypothetical protein
MSHALVNFFEPIICLTFFQILAYDILVGVFVGLPRYVRWISTNTKSPAIKLSASVIAFCAAAGAFYGNFFLDFYVALVAVYAYPVVDILTTKNRSKWDYIRFGALLVWLFFSYKFGRYESPCTFS